MSAKPTYNELRKFFKRESLKKHPNKVGNRYKDEYYDISTIINYLRTRYD